MGRRKKWHKFTAVLLATAMLMTTLTVPTARAEEEVKTVVSTEVEDSGINSAEIEDADTDTTGRETGEQETTDTIPDSAETVNDGEVSGSEALSPSNEEDFEVAETLQPSDTENSDRAETSEQPEPDKEDSKDTTTTEQSDTEQSDKQEQFVLKGNVTLEDITGKNMLWKDILVRLYDANTYDEKAEKHTYIAETLTKKDGSYTFEDVESGNYRIEFINRNTQYDDITCKWKKPVNGEKKLYTVELTREKVGLDKNNKEENEEDDKNSEEQKEYFAFIKKIALPQKDLLHTEQDDIYMEVNLALVEIESEEQEEKKLEEAGTDTEAESENTEGTEATLEEGGQSGTTENTETTTEEAEEDYSDMMSIEDLKHIDGDIAGATMEKTERSPYDIMPMLVNAAAWSFDAYYVDEVDKYNVTKTDNYFKLKYQMEFHANRNLEVGAVTIRIPRTLFTYRSGAKIVPTEIAIPEGTPENVHENGSIPFNYYVDENDNLVFFNYKAIESGTNIAFQILYKNLESMLIEDMTKWSLQSEITVTIDDTSETRQSTPLTGCVDTGVTLTSVIKTAYREGGKSYTPGLYTTDQLMRYVDVNTLASTQYLTNFDNYKYVVWKVDVKGTATQPWRLEIKDTSDNGGVVVGYKAVDDDWVIDGGTTTDGYTQITDYMTSSIIRGNSGQSCSFYVVTAYPKANVTSGTSITNTVDVRLRPMDNEEDMVEGSSSDTWSYANYAWEYPGHDFKLEKNSTSNAAYGGWLELYRRVQERDYINMELPSLDFKITSECRGYDYTHNIDPELENFGEQIEGNSYSVTVVDDFVYAYPNAVNTTNYAILDGKDYYYSAITVSSVDQGYDVYEDNYAEPEVAGSLRIYAIYADDATNLEANAWTEVATIPWDSNGEMSYTFTPAQLAQHPWRVKVVHNTTNYEIDIEINVSMRLRIDSPSLAKLLADYPDLQTMEIENLAGTTVEQFENGNTEDGTGKYVEDSLLGEGRYEEPELKENTEKMYPVLLYRNPATVELTGLEKDAGAYKSGKTTNDPNNSRTMVTYQLSAYDGYKVSSQEMANNLKSFGVESPGRNDVVFYDLLPYGMHYDPSYEVKAARMTGAVGSDGWKSTSDSQVSVTTEVQDNYNNTGRTMLIFRIHYEGGDSASFYIGKNDKFGRWKEHWGVSFTAYYAWKDMSAVKSSSNICAFMPSKEDNLSLLGTDKQVAKDNGVVVPSSLQNDCKYFGSDIDGDGNTEEQTVLYASATAYEDIAIYTESKIEKLVRADSDVYDVYQESTVVAPGEGYTYDITVSTLEASIKNIVIFDRLENAAIDRKGQSGTVNFDANPWHGTFVSVVTGGLEALGIQPMIYYNANRAAEIPTGNELANNVLTQAKGWYKAEDWESVGYSPKDVAAVAVDLGEYSLESGQSVTFQIKMQAPSEDVKNDSHAYNNPYYCSTTGDGTIQTLSGNITSVRLYGMEEVEVIKEFIGDIPEDVADTSFEFYLTQVENKTLSKFSNREYQLYRKNGAIWERQGEGRIYATDADGRLVLREGEKAVFQVADADRIQAEEEENPYWQVEKTAEWIELAGSLRRHAFTFTNAYRPILYVQKKVESVPQGVDTSDDTFTFQVFADGEPLANAEFWYLDCVRLDGGSPNRVKSLGNTGIGTTDAEGRFTIKAGEIIGLFPGNVETQYMVQEIVDSGVYPKWVCEENTAKGIITLRGASVTISNIYARKELRLTKEIRYQDVEECTQEFKFQVLDITDNPDGVSVSGNRWVLLDGSTETETEGTLDAEGTFACAMAGKTVKICDLQANHTYLIKEIDSGEYYVPVQDAQEVTMPLYATGSNVIFTNDYQRRSLTVTKQVAYSDTSKLTDINSREFTMTAQIKEVKTGETHSLANIPYVRTSQDGEETDGTTDANGTFTIKNGESVFFKDVGVKGDEITVTETPDDDYPQLYPADDKPHTEILGDTDCEMNFVNGEQGNLVVINNVVAVDDGGRELLEAIKSSKLGINPPSSRSQAPYLPSPPGFQFDFILNANSNDTPEISWTIDSTLKAVNQLSSFWSQSYDERYVTDNSTKLYPGDIITIPVTGRLETAAYSYEISMDEDSRNFIWCWNSAPGGRKWFEISLIEPENGGAIKGTLADAPVVTFVSEVKEITMDGSKIEKRMVPGSDTVSDGAKLVWRLERYNGSKWESAQGVSYVVMNEIGCPDEDAGIQMTGADGRITLTKYAVTYPVVQFLKDTVYLNRYGDANIGDLRLVELLEESDETWGRLAGYGNEAGEYSLSMSSDKAVAFVNSNRTTLMQIAKEMKTTSEESFTMYLRQVLSSSGDTITTTKDIIESVEGAGIEYILYDSRTNKETGRGTTGEKGEIRIKAGEYATFYLPDKTVWTVEEEIKANYELVDLSGIPEEQMTKLQDVNNQMVVYQKAETIESYMLKAKFVNINYNGTHYVRTGSTGYSYLNTLSNYVVVLCNSDGEEIKTLDYRNPDFEVDLSQLPYGPPDYALNFTGSIQIPIYGRGEYEGLSTYVMIPVVNGDNTITSKSDLEKFYLEIDENGNLEIPFIVRDKYNNDALTAVSYIESLSDCNKLNNLVVGDGISRISYLSCSSLESLVIPGSIYARREDTWFSTSCDMLKKVVVEDGVTIIPNQAFTRLKRLTNITLPNSITTIPYQAFYECTNLTDITLPDSITIIEQNAFKGCSALKNISLPNNLVTITGGAFTNCISLESLDIPKSVTQLNKIFDGCSSLKTITLHDGLQTLADNYLFQGCTSLEEITIPGSVGTIISNTFSNSSIKTIVLEEGVQKIESAAFSNATALKVLKIPNSVTYIGGGLFQTGYGSTMNSLEIYIDKPKDYFDYSTWNIPQGSTIYWQNGEKTEF